MHFQARVSALAAATWLVVGCASSAARPGGPEPVVMVGDGVKAKAAADKPAVAEATKDPNDARRKALEDAAEFGMLGVLGGSSEGAGEFFGTGPQGGVVGGFGGLGLSGVGGGGTGEGIGLGRIGTAGHGYGYGSSSRPHERVKARIEASTIKGPLTEDVVQRILADHRDDVQDCYLLEAKRNAHVRGRMTLSVTLDATGRVDEVWVPETSFWSRELASCVAQVVGTFRFPAAGSPDAPVKVRLDVTF